MSSTKRTPAYPAYNLPRAAVATVVVTVAAMVAEAAVTVAATAVEAAVTVAAGFGGAVVAAVEAVQAATGAGGPAFGSGAIIDIAGVAASFARGEWKRRGLCGQAALAATLKRRGLMFRSEPFSDISARPPHVAD
jgi:hypothetical protein